MRLPSIANASLHLQGKASLQNVGVLLYAECECVRKLGKRSNEECLHLAMEGAQWRG